MGKLEWIFILFFLLKFADSAFTVPESVSLGTIYRPGNCTSAMEITSFSGNKTVDQCAEECRLVLQCIAFTWHETGSCSLKSTTCSSPNTTDAKNHYFEMLPFDYFHRKGDCPGGDLSYPGNVAFTYCRNWCTTRSYCKTFQWSSRIGGCYPKSNTCAHPSLADSASNFFDKLPVLNDFDIAKDYIYSAGSCSGNDLELLLRRTIKLCAFDCTYRAACKAYVWTEVTGDCQLKSAVCTATVSTGKHLYIKNITNIGWYTTDNTPPGFYYTKVTQLPDGFSLAGKTREDIPNIDRDVYCAQKCASKTCVFFKRESDLCTIYT